MKTFPVSDIEFKYQFKISKFKNIYPEGWSTVDFDEWTISFCRYLKLTKLVDKKNKVIGYILGWAINPDGLLLSDIVSVDFCFDDKDFEAKIELYYSYLSGRFIALSIINFRLYIDPAGQLSVVYNIATGEIASSLFLISDFHEPIDEFSKVLNFPNVDRFFPFGITINENVIRVIPNHYLDIKSLSQIRHWPVHSEFSHKFSNLSTADIIYSIAEQLKNNIDALAKNYTLSMSLTAGKDSRMLLAASKKYFNSISVFTTSIPDKQAILDCKIAEIISKKFNIDHTILNWVSPKAQDLIDWQIKGGFSGAGRTWQSVTTLKQLDSSKIILTGLCGEVGRSFYWRKEDLKGGNLTPSLILKRMGFPEHPKLLKLAQEWCVSLLEFEFCDALDLLYIEQRLGCWAGPNYYGHDNIVRIAPLSDRKIFELMISLPKEYRYQDAMPKDIIMLLWPDLLSFPFNEPIGIARFNWQFKKVLKSIFKVFKQ